MQTTLTARRLAALVAARGTLPCAACGGSRFWWCPTLPVGEWVCGNCHAPASGVRGVRWTVLGAEEGDAR